MLVPLKLSKACARADSFLSLQPVLPPPPKKRSPAAAEERGRKDSERLAELRLAVAPELNSGKLLDI